MFLSVLNFNFNNYTNTNVNLVLSMFQQMLKDYQFNSTKLTIKNDTLSRLPILRNNKAISNKEK